MVDDVRGVTLLELVVLLGVLSILGGLASPKFAGALEGLELHSGALRVVAELRRARHGALAEGRVWALRRIDARTFSVGPQDGPQRTISLPARVRFTATTSGGEVLFRPGGWAENATFEVGLNGSFRAVVVNQRGRISLRRESGS